MIKKNIYKIKPRAEEHAPKKNIIDTKNNTQQCYRCLQTFSLSEQYFIPYKKSKSGFYKLCKQCFSNSRPKNASKKRFNKNFDYATNSKKCTKCKEWLSIDNFYNVYRDDNQVKLEKKVNNKLNICKKCAQIKNKKRITNFEEKLKEIYNTIKYNKRCIDVSIDLEDLNQILKKQTLKHNNYPSCFYLNIPITWKPNMLNTISIDRIDSKLGYCKDNIVFCARYFNELKHDYPIDFIDKVLDEILNLHSENFSSDIVDLSNINYNRKNRGNI